MAVLTWNRFVGECWSQLCAGETVAVLKTEIEHPTDTNMRELLIAEPMGQSRDYAMSLPDGSRIHVHVFAEHYAVHRDEIDPASGIVPAFKHYIKEAPSSGLVMSFGAAFAGIKLLARFLRG